MSQACVLQQSPHCPPAKASPARARESIPKSLRRSGGPQNNRHSIYERARRPLATTGVRRPAANCYAAIEILSEEAPEAAFVAAPAQTPSELPSGAKPEGK